MLRLLMPPLLTILALFRYLKYEFNKPMLEIYLTKKDVPWLQILSLLPFARYFADN